MQTVENASEHTRSWPALQVAEDTKNVDGDVVRAAGSTLELDPGESAQVELPEGFEDEHLRVLAAPAVEPAAVPKPTPPAAPETPTDQEPAR